MYCALRQSDLAGCSVRIGVDGDRYVDVYHMKKEIMGEEPYICLQRRIAISSTRQDRHGYEIIMDAIQR